MPESSRRKRLKFIVTCLDAPGCNVYFEPEGAVIPLSVGSALHVELTGEDDDSLEISYRTGGIVIGAYWNSSGTRVWDREGRQLEPREPPVK
jgi:hypothetical protein